MNKIYEYNGKIDKNENAGETVGKKEKIAITGADATGLYPSLQGRQSGRLVKEAYMKSSLEVEGINYKETARYIAMEYDRFEIRQMGLERLIPSRRYIKGAKPGVTGKEPLSKEVEDEVRWVFPPGVPTTIEKRKLLAAALEIGVRKAFSLHLYQFGGKFYHQRDGGPIGMRLAGSVARIVMGEWGVRLRKILSENNIKCWLDGFYVDDVRLVTSILEKGMRWQVKEKKFGKKDGWEIEDEKEDISDERRTAIELQNAMNSIFPNIQFTIEIPEDFPEGKLPTLDFKCWQEKERENETSSKEQTWQETEITSRSRILYSFFEKNMNSPFCILEKSALPESTKFSSLSQDLIRRMLHTSEIVSQQERNIIIEKYVNKLTISGYRQDQVKKIVEAGLRGYQAKLEKARKSGVKLHRSGKSTENLRYKKKLLEKNNWFKKTKIEGEDKTGDKNTSKNRGEKGLARKVKSGANTTPLAVLFVPRTPNGELAKKLRQAEEDIEKLTGDRIKIVEKAGIMLKRVLHKSNPWAGGPCSRPDCLVCSHEKGGGNCQKRNITYKTECQSCQERSGKERIYVGESARTAYERGQEHSQDYLKLKEDSHMYKHWVEEHQGEQRPIFSMKVIRSHVSAFARQIHEAVCIEINASKTLNSKGEYNRCQLPRLGVKMGERDANIEKERSVQLTENEIFHAVRADHKRKESVHQELCQDQPASKKRKTKIKIPEKSYPSKRMRDESKQGNQGNMKKFKSETNSAAETRSIHRHPKIHNHGPQNPRIKTKISVQEITNFFERKSTPGTPTTTIQPQNVKRNEKVSMQKITSFFEKSSAVSKTGGGGDTAKNKANPTISSTYQKRTTTSYHQPKNRVKSSKIIPPARATNTISKLFNQQLAVKKRDEMKIMSKQNGT